MAEELEELEELEGLDKEPSEYIDQPKKIVALIKQALLAEEHVEVRINDQPRAFFTQFLDHEPPSANADPVEEDMQEEGEGEDEGPYEELSYLDKQDRLLIAPVEPAVGNGQVRASRTLSLLFFDNRKSFTADVTFKQVVQQQDGPVFELSFPERLGVRRMRRHFRSRVEYGVRTNVTVSPEKGRKVSKVELINLSMGGLAWSNAKLINEYEPGTRLKFNLEVDRLPSIEVWGSVRNQGMEKVPRRGGKSISQPVVGIAFELEDNLLVKRVEEAATFVQREYLSRLKMKREALQKPEAKAPAGKKAALKGLFKAKKKYFS
ncbi:PilZ domain-containing protein [Magnetococcus sp. PR-3]|uniref:PilZ domain-containing protein n=1 Tax=Magnetococcus sp. PR-3 TaxID=3120355 RepID=UPI002FCE431D